MSNEKSIRNLKMGDKVFIVAPEEIKKSSDGTFEYINDSCYRGKFPVRLLEIPFVERKSWWNEDKYFFLINGANVVVDESVVFLTEKEANVYLESVRLETKISDHKLLHNVVDSLNKLLTIHKV